MFRRKPRYSQVEIAAQLGAIAEIIKFRERAVQRAVLAKSDVQQQKILEIAADYDEAESIAIEVLKFMLDENLRKGKR